MINSFKKFQVKFTKLCKFPKKVIYALLIFFSHAKRSVVKWFVLFFTTLTMTTLFNRQCKLLEIIFSQVLEVVAESRKISTYLRLLEEVCRDCDSSLLLLCWSSSFCSSTELAIEADLEPFELKVGFFCWLNLANKPCIFFHFTKIFFGRNFSFFPFTLESNFSYEVEITKQFAIFESFLFT